MMSNTKKTAYRIRSKIFIDVIYASSKESAIQIVANIRKLPFNSFTAERLPIRMGEKVED